jgi:hypothetical protein
MDSYFPSGIYMTNKKSKTTKKSSKTKGKKSKNEITDEGDTGIIIIDDEMKFDKGAELEARKAYLEEAKSQESSSD